MRSARPRLTDRPGCRFPPDFNLVEQLRRAASALHRDRRSMPTSPELRDRVLIVLADDELAPTIQRALEQAAYRPRIVSTPEEARALLESGLGPCVVLFAMPTLDDGREFIRKHDADTTTATGGESDDRARLQALGGRVRRG
jgi:hypothetical protein